ncbi:probable sulfite oxidase, mitochondrial [Drosophila guanche]|uniref:sulfite oxidase n=1 Tax=Drosophila guanche TaxID=7266 RepID=A0A3B0JZU4_DROGU|nr:probable sulfite oxidase, mitochondrial [Drosophila guanche]SPP86593.1 blast:Probable sulfite oxidase%2C mitochondrial [Drosophila guanche]
MRLLWQRSGMLQKLMLQRKHYRRWLATTTASARGNGQEEKYNARYKWRKPECKAEMLLYGVCWTGGLGLAYFLLSQRGESEAKLDDEALARLWHITVRKDLPTYKAEQVEQHNAPDKRIWVTFGLGVYDVTEFAENHPGGDKIMMAAGSAIDPFWAIYQQHNTLEVLELLESFRIGNLEGVTVANTDEELGSPWAQEPKRHALLKPASKRPFNAEPPIGLLAEKFYTPNELFYVRNHLPVPVLAPEEYELEIDAGGGEQKEPLTLTLAQIKALPKHTVTAAIMCGGNRRSEMTSIKAVKGLSWGAGAVGNAKWSGARLCDLLREQGVQPNESMHVIFEGADLDPTSHPYGASIPLSKALDPRGDVILAYEMNDNPLTRDHGYPIRVIVPGTVGARNVKWLTRIVVADHESDSHWQQNDYKGFSPSTDWDTVDFGKADAIQAMPVTSAICTPLPGERVKVNPQDGYITVRGYAWSGGGRKILRVDLTGDAGQTWHVAELEQEDAPDGRHYGWSLWTARLPITKDQQEQEQVEIWAKAVDSAYNVQPEKFEHIWNLRGVLANAYHKVKVKLA